jgi:hypothetical protein
MLCFIYRFPEGHEISIPTGEFMQSQIVDPIDHLESEAVNVGLKYVRKDRTITVCVDNDFHRTVGQMTTRIEPIVEYLSYAEAGPT